MGSKGLLVKLTAIKLHHHGSGIFISTITFVGFERREEGYIAHEKYNHGRATKAPSPLGLLPPPRKIRFQRLPLGDTGINDR